MNPDALRAARNIMSGRGPTTATGVNAHREGVNAVRRALFGNRARGSGGNYEEP